LNTCAAALSLALLATSFANAADPKPAPAKKSTDGAALATKAPPVKAAAAKSKKPALDPAEAKAAQEAREAKAAELKIARDAKAAEAKAARMAKVAKKKAAKDAEAAEAEKQAIANNNIFQQQMQQGYGGQQGNNMNRNGNNRSRNQIANLATVQMMRRFDTNQNGRLDPAEQKAAQAAMAQLQAGGGNLAAAQMMQQFDVDGDGQLSAAERQAAQAAITQGLGQNGAAGVPGQLNSRLPVDGAPGKARLSRGTAATK